MSSLQDAIALHGALFRLHPARPGLYCLVRDEHLTRRLTMQPQPSHPFTSDLTGQEFWLVLDKGYTPLGLVLGNCVYSMGAMGGLMAGLRGAAGGEVGQYSKLMYDARELALARMQAEATRLGADGVIGVDLKI